MGLNYILKNIVCKNYAAIYYRYPNDYNNL